MAEYETDEEFFDVLVEPETPKVRLDLTSVKESQEQSTTTPTLPETSANDMFDPNHLQNIGRWLQSICSDDIVALRQTSAYQDFLRAFDRLGRTHRRVVAMNRSIMEVDEVANEQRKNPSKNMIAHFSFLQQLAGDDVVLRVFEFLECHSLVRTSATCSRFRDLATASATQRTRRIALTRQLDHVMKLLRAKEHVEGVAGSEPHDCHISVPLLGMRQRIIVTDAGDPEYNGIYHCTGTNGNGYVFTKPRNSTSRTTVSEATFTNTEMDFVGIQTTDPILREQAKTLCWDEAVEPGKLLRCIIAKRFSNEVRIRMRPLQCHMRRTY